MKVYVMIKEGVPFQLENLVLVGRKSDADRLIEDGFATYYEEKNILSGSEISEFFKRINNEGVG